MLAREDGALLPPKRARQLLAGGAAVLAIDPGNDGAAVTRFPNLDFSTLDDWEKVARMVYWDRPIVLLLEDQFGGRSFAAAKEVAWTSGALTGFLFAHQSYQFTLVHVAGATWQAAQRRRMGVYGVQLDRDAGIELALEELVKLAPKAYESVNKAKREGFASALGILLWWEGLVAQCKG
jgi:hypothetical protein